MVEVTTTDFNPSGRAIPFITVDFDHSTQNAEFAISQEAMTFLG